MVGEEFSFDDDDSADDGIVVPTTWCRMVSVPVKTDVQPDPELVVKPVCCVVTQ